MNNFLFPQQSRKVRSPKRLPRPPRFKLPSAYWERYYSILQEKIINKWKEATNKNIIEKLDLIERQVKMERPNGMQHDSWPDDITHFINVLSADYDVINRQSEQIAAGVFDAINGISHEQWWKTAKAVLGVNLMQYEPWIRNEMKAFTQENISLITKTGKDTLHDINRIVVSGFRQGKRAETLKKEIFSGTDLQPGVFQKVSTRAALIARDQSLKLYGNLNHLRQEQNGISVYIWRTVEDERVRGTPGGKYPNAIPSHFLMDGKYCKWSDPTVYADTLKEVKEDNWKSRTADMPKDHPGVEINDRCTAEPVFDILPEGGESE